MARIGAATIGAGLAGYGPEQHTPARIAAGIARMLDDGGLAAGDRLPVVRDLARELGVSTGTVAAAWHNLAALGLIESRGRAGTYVLPTPESWLPPRYRGAGEASGPVALDLSTGTPDPALLPELRGALLAAVGELSLTEVNSYLAPPVLPGLASVLRDGWPYRVTRITVVDGAMDGVIRTLEQVVRFGDRVGVESPGFPPIFDILDQLGLVPVPLELDRSGATPASIGAAIDAGARALILQPRAQNPTGVSMTPTRLRDIAAVIRARIDDDHGRRLVVLEDDHAGGIVRIRDLSLGTHLPDRVVHVRSYSKTHGPDLRIAAVGGPAAIIDPLVARRMMGVGWTSRLLQSVLARMLVDPVSRSRVDRAAVEYARRRRTMAAALAGHGVDVAPGDGLTMWIPVADEQAAVERLLAAGVRVTAGDRYLARRRGGAVPGRGPEHIRITLGALTDDIDTVATLIARAARP